MNTDFYLLTIEDYSLFFVAIVDITIVLDINLSVLDVGRWAKVTKNSNYFLVILTYLWSLPTIV